MRLHQIVPSVTSYLIPIPLMAMISLWLLSYLGTAVISHSFVSSRVLIKALITAVISQSYFISKFPTTASFSSCPLNPSFLVLALPEKELLWSFNYKLSLIPKFFNGLDSLSPFASRSRLYSFKAVCRVRFLSLNTRPFVHSASSSWCFSFLNGRAPFDGQRYPSSLLVFSKVIIWEESPHLAYHFGCPFGLTRSSQGLLHRSLAWNWDLWSYPTLKDPSSSR